VREARAVCPDLVLVPQSPDLYRRAYNALIAEIMAVIPIAAIKSIDELTADVETSDRANPRELGERVKSRLKRCIGPTITCSIGSAANRQRAKMACKAGRWSGDSYGDGLAIWAPVDMPGRPLPKDASGRMPI
jgi:DNA polymerase-4